MKKILMMAFVSMALLATVSCSKDDDKKSDPPTIKGTLWEANIDYDVMILGSGSIEVQLFFKNESVCRMDIDFPAALAVALEQLLGHGIDLDSGEYEYTFDGEKVVITLNSQPIELEYTGSTLVFKIPSQYSSIASMAGISEVVFYKR